MGDATRLERRLDRALARATTPRGAAIVIATVSTVMTVGAGIVMTVLDHENFPSVGLGLWWAAQTVTTVGYRRRRSDDPRRTARRRARHALGDRLPDGHHRRDHEHVRVALTT
jgi:hypothetical protein